MLKTLDSFFNVSPNQKALLKIFVLQIKKNQEKANLIGKSTLNKIWVRHVLDSMQIIKYLPIEKRGKFMVDVGTGAGFPGVVLHIMGRKNILLCDKSSKKTYILKKILKECSLNIEVSNTRIENYFKDNIEVIVSRAFASIKKLMISIYHLISRDTILIIHKGKKYRQEIEEAERFFFLNLRNFKVLQVKKELF